MDRTQLLNLLIDQLHYSSYLELGTDKCVNFAAVKLLDKTGVDIRARATYIMSTDTYFQICDRKFDLIFIDACHLADQAYRDFENSLQHLNPGGCIVFHDCMPKIEVHQLVRQRTKSWTGDVWKAFVKVRQLADVDACVVDTDWGLGIVFQRPNSQPLINIPELSWATYVLQHTELLRVIPPNELDSFLPTM